MKQLKEDLKNQTFHPVYLLYGEEDYLKRMYRDRLKKAVLGDGDEMNYSYFEGKAPDSKAVAEIADTMPFLRTEGLWLLRTASFSRRRRMICLWSL